MKPKVIIKLGGRQRGDQIDRCYCEYKAEMHLKMFWARFKDEESAISKIVGSFQNLDKTKENRHNLFKLSLTSNFKSLEDSKLLFFKV